jgi:hypothetical protein
MTDYTKSTNFASKDTLSPGSALKIVRGTEIDTEFNNIATAVATKADLASPALTGTPTAPTASAGDNDTSIATTAFVSTAVSNAVGALGNTFGFKNRIINGAMVIDQRNAGASFTPTSGASYGLDRYRYYLTQSSKLTSQQSSTAPAGFINSLLVTSSSAYSVISSDIFQVSQPIEGLNMADLAWGTASAATVTLSFWVRSSLTGTFGGSIGNSSGARSYVFSYTISAANTWEQKSVTIAGDTSGTWLTTNGVGAYVNFGLGVGSSNSNTAGAWYGAAYNSATGATSVVGTNGATFYITGVQLEKGSTATSFDYRPYGTELALCQRYFVELMGGTNGYQPLGLGNTYSTTQGSYLVNLPAPMRTATPSLTTVGNIYFQNLGNVNISSFAGPYSQKGTIVEGDFTMASAVTANITSFMRFNNVNTATAKFNFSAEL